MRKDLANKLIITAAISGAEVTQEMNPNVPYTVEEFVREAKSAVAAGAAVIHLHVREDDGTPTQDRDRFAEIISAIEAECPDVIIQPSTGGATGMSADERLQPTELNPEMASLDCGTLNFGGDEIFVNTENMIIEFAARMHERNIMPELECFDKSMIDMALRLHKKGYIKAPLHFNLVLGVNGGISATPRDLLFLVESLPEDATFTVSAMGRHQLTLNVMSMLLGGHVRTGFEDNLMLDRGVVAESNGVLVERLVRIAQELNLEIATPDEAREIMGLPLKKKQGE
ncbi:MAG: 3-keto-5-aminohexanoate cleavage protein [Eubacteriales bacterium]|nr:3-keto-5-aminohexanoate cleavage protein [Eubacteriales bacterium]MDD4324270.1 3-keto-5-aminohexanoate cleavage protein [Eubacteriales bacterium]MDD4541098.1 3-keto-5-aminohexanoate cleavage protein [Eubacteriales bacterium]